MIYPTDGGNNSASTYYNAVQKYAESFWTSVQWIPTVAPNYSTLNADTNRAVVLTRYKYSDSDPTSYASGHAITPRVYGTGNPGGSAYEIVRFNSDTIMKVFIADTSYGFMADVEYTYLIIYSE